MKTTDIAMRLDDLEKYVSKTLEFLQNDLKLDVKMALIVADASVHVLEGITGMSVSNTSMCEDPGPKINDAIN